MDERSGDRATETIVRDADCSRSVSEVVVETVAIATDTDPLDLDPLYEAVDTDGLNGLFAAASEDSDLSVTFRTNGCTVTVRRTDALRVAVRPTDGSAEFSREI